MKQQPPIPPAPIPPVQHGKTSVDGAPVAYNPGQATGIIGLVLAFAGLAPIGLVLSIISTVQSKKAKASSILGVLGIVFNGVAVAVFTFLIAIFVIAASQDPSIFNFSEGSQSNSQAQDTAQVVSRNAKIYNSYYDKFPQTINDFEIQKETSLTGVETDVIAMTPTDTQSVQYKACGKSGAKIAYMTSVDDELNVIYLGDGNAETCLDSQNKV